MTQVRMEYLRWITIYLWCCGIPACDQEPEYRLLNYTSLERLRESLQQKLTGTPQERFMELRDAARTWFLNADSDRFRAAVRRFDANLPPPEPGMRSAA